MRCARKRGAAEKKGGRKLKNWSFILALIACLVMGGCLVEKSKEEIKQPLRTVEYPWHRNIVATWFDISDVSSSGLGKPATCWNDVDPVMEENPFYCALPFNNNVYHGENEELKKQMKNRWVEIKNLENGRVAYAQWEDCGPWFVNDADYVFSPDGRVRPRAESAYNGFYDIYGNASTTRKITNKAGIDISPRTRDYLGMHDIGVVDWRFVDASQVPDGPWMAKVSTLPPHYESRSPSVMILYHTTK